MTRIDAADQRDGDPTRRRRWVRWLVRVGGGVALLVGAAVAAWVALLPDVEPTPLAEVVSDPDLRVRIDDDVAIVAPASGDIDTTVVFYPGAGVPPAAYLPTWAPVVERIGVRVVVPAMPLRLAVLDSDAATEVRDALAGVDGDDGQWWVGGHSLGGAMSASYLATQPPGAWDGLVLWGAYPPGDALGDRDELAVVSVAGERDGLTTLAEVEASRGDLPEDAVVAVLDGVTHAQFGAYGDQRGDGEATVGDGVARRRIAEATAAVIGTGAAVPESP